ncbi:MAG TPA: sensor histidine kinase [Parafilimonas sp.]|nr:sensor histidine kinase [Parafilimonas sp.]
MPVKFYLSSITKVLALFLCNSCFAQTIPDSLTDRLNNAVNDSARVIALLEIGESVEPVTPARSFYYYQQALALAKKIKNDRCVLSSLHDVGVCYIELNKLDSAIVTFEQAIPFAKQLNDTVRIARLLANIGNVYLHKKDRLTGIDYYLQSARLWETAADQQWLPVVYANINGLLNDQKEYYKALEYGNKGLALATKLGDDNSIINTLINLSETYNFLGKFEEQYKLLQRALPLAKKRGNIEVIAAVYENLGDYYYQEKQYSLSLDNYQQNHDYVLQMGNKYALSGSFSMLAEVYNKLGRNDKALEYILQAEKIAGEVGVRADLREIYLTRATIEQQLGHYKLAGEYFSKTLILTDSLFKVETSQKVAEVEARYQNEKKQLEISQLEKDKKIQALSIKQKSTLNYFLIASLAALLIVGFLIYRNLYHRQLLAKQQDELQQQRIRELEKDKQLVVVDSMLKGQEEERKRLAKDLHDGLGGMLTGVKFSLMNMKSNLTVGHDDVVIFERSLDMLDTSIQELRRVAHNMMPEALVKFGLDEALRDYCNNLNTAHIFNVRYQSFGIEERLDHTSEIIIYRIIQELLNNIFKHAKATEVLVQLFREETRLNITVEDNGKGFDISDLEKNKGAGWANIRSRVEYLKGKLDLHSDSSNGTSVNIELNT